MYVTSQARNITENARVLNIELADVMTDATYDAVTPCASSRPASITRSATMAACCAAAASKSVPTAKYWTLIRGNAARGRPRTEPVCPACGAPLQIGMAGNCEYCHARIVSGEFDWVLSRIEQDEAYGG